MSQKAKRHQKQQIAQLSQWQETVSTRLPHLSVPQATVLALWSFGMVIGNSCGLTSVAVYLAALLGQKENTVRQRLREWYRAAPDKKGAKRTEVVVETCFTSLVRWVLDWWTSAEKRLAIALDATTLGQVFTVLAVCIVYRGCAIPVAWVVVSATTKGSWKPHWERLFQDLKGSLPADWFVVVLADRGLYARWLYEAIVELGWHPFLRINKGGTYRRQAESGFRPLASVAPTVGSWWCGQVTCFKTNRLPCTLLACWREGHKDPWLIVTDLSPEQAEVFWYGMRMWIECGFKQTKRAGWQWQATRMTEPERAARLWLAIAVATLWVVSVGGEAEDNLPASSFDELPPMHVARRNCRSTNRSQPRLLSCFRRGLIVIRVTLMTGQPLPLGRFIPEPWPTDPDVCGERTDLQADTPDIMGKEGAK